MLRNEETTVTVTVTATMMGINGYSCSKLVTIQRLQTFPFQAMRISKPLSRSKIRYFQIEPFSMLFFWFNSQFSGVNGWLGSGGELEKTRKYRELGPDRLYGSDGDGFHVLEVLRGHRQPPRPAVVRRNRRRLRRCHSYLQQVDPN